MLLDTSEEIEIVQEVNLDACPVCGSAVELHRYDNEDGVPYSSIYCENCGTPFRCNRSLEGSMVNNWNNALIRNNEKLEV